MFSQASQRPEKPGKGTIVVTRHCPNEMRQRSTWSIDQFVVAKKLGGGYASTVHLAICKATGTQVAIKVYHRCKLSQLNNYQVQREVRIHSCLDHKNVLQLYAAFEDEVGVYLVTEYASRGDVFGELDRRGGSMTEADAVRQVLSPFLSALDYLHLLNIIHRDIKPENLLFTATGVLKVADFGLSIDITQERPVTRVGTLDYMAPEVVICPDKCHPSDHKEKTHLHYTYLVDAWAVGVLAYELTVGRAPFDAGHKRGTIENILHSQPRFPAWISDSARHFVNWSLTKDTTKRPGIQQLGEHPWIHQHAGATRPSKAINAGRAVSFHNLSMYTDPASKAGGESHQPRHKMGEGLNNGSSGEKLDELEEEEEEEEVFVSASGEGCPAAMQGVTSDQPAAPDAARQQQQQQATATHKAPSYNSFTCGGSSSSTNKPPVPGAAVLAPAAAAAAANPGTTVTTAPPALPPGVSPFAAAASAPAPAPAASSALMSLPVLGAAADKLRAFVHRCQSANDIEALKAFMLLQPPEPSNACFEPGGRFFTGPPAGSSAAAAAAGSNSQQQQQNNQPQQGAATAAAGKHAMSGHDSAASLASHCSSSSSSSSRPADLPRSSPSAGLNNSSSQYPPKPLQLVKLPDNLGAGMPRSDSCRSLQGLAGITEGKAEGHDSMGGGATPMSPGGGSGSLQGAASSSPMAVSPAALNAAGGRGELGSQKGNGRSVFDSPTHGGSGSRTDPSASASTSSCSCSSSCESAMGSSARGSVSSSHSWGYQQNQQQQHQPHQAPQPHSPPCSGGKGPAAHSNNPFAPRQHIPSPAAAAEPSDFKGLTAAAGGAGNQGEAVETRRTPSCNELEHLISICRSGQAVPLGSSAPAGQRAIVAISADCRTAAAAAADAAQQQQLQGLDHANGCFGFLKSPRR